MEKLEALKMFDRVMDILWETAKEIDQLKKAGKDTMSICRYAVDEETRVSSLLQEMHNYEFSEKLAVLVEDSYRYHFLKDSIKDLFDSYCI